MIPARLIRAIAVFVPAVGPLEAEIASANATVEEALTIAKPIIDRMEAGEPAFLEVAEADPKIVAMIPQIILALKTFAKVNAIAEDYTDRVDKAVG